MTKRALVLGSQIEGLTGVHNDVDEMATMLRGRGFLVDVRTDAQATRDGILAGYRALIAAAAEDDVAVVYYSGHGFYEHVPDRGAWQCIAPTDLRRGTEQDWRGITAWELSLLQQELTTKTKNVTVILDCCHAAQMSRDAASMAAVPRALPHPVKLGFDNHLRALARAYPTALGTLHALGNQHAVRLVACAQDTSAYEYPGANGKRRGIFTETLLDVLQEAGTATINWLTVVDVVRARVLRTIATQRPDVEGPARRRLFELAEHDSTGLARIAVKAGGYQLPTGRLGGDNAGDVYAVLPDGTTKYEPGKETARLVVTKVHPVTSDARLETGAAPSPDALAVPIAREAIRRPVRLDVPADHRAQLEAKLEAIPTLRIAVDGEPALATLRLADGKLTIADAQGPLFPATKFPDELDGTLSNVAALATAQGVRELEGTHDVHEHEVQIEIGVVEDGQRRRLTDTGSAVGLGNRIYIEVRNTSQRQLYAHVFNIGVRGDVRLLTSYAPAGVRITQDQPCLVGKNAANIFAGLKVFWPEGLPRESFPRIDEVAVFVTSEPVDLRGLETTIYQTRSAGANALQQLVSQQQDGKTRDLEDDGQVSGYYMKRLSWLLHPREGAIGGVAFEIDDAPGMGAARSIDAWLVPHQDAAIPKRLDAPEAIAIRLGDLVVENNRAFGAADVRVDALVTTRAAAGGYTTWTQKFENIQDGDRLPLDKTLLFHGPVQDFVDISLFVSRDVKDSLDLSQLFAQRLTSPELGDALGALLLTAGVVAAPWVTAVGASAVLTRIAYELLMKLKNKSIGLYRTSFLRHEQFGVGRHPVEALHRAQGFSFSLLVEPVA